MNKSDVLSLQRLYRLIINDLRMQSKNILIIVATLAVYFLFLFSGGNETKTYFIFLYLGGFIITSLAFKDLHNPNKAYLSLMLPCSNLERFLNKWFLTSVGYAIGVLLLYYLLYFLSSVINLFIFHYQIRPMNIFQSNLWIGIGKYIVLQSVVLFGAITFKRYALIKTLLVAGCFFFVLSLFVGLIVQLYVHYFLNNLQNMNYLRFPNQHLFSGIFFFFWVIVAPFFWCATYFRLTEYELK